MIRRITFAVVILLAATVVLAAGAPDSRHTVIVKNGRIFSGDGDLFRSVYLGFSPLDASPELREFLGAPKDAGVIVQTVKDGSPAAKAGVRVGDVVVAIDGRPVESSWTIGELLDGMKAGDTVRVEIIRNHARQTLVATLEDRELPYKLRTLDVPGVRILPEKMWRARVETGMPDCIDLQSRIKDLEMRLKGLEKKLDK